MPFYIAHIDGLSSGQGSSLAGGVAELLFILPKTMKNQTWTNPQQHR
jgi:hypothetical protein